MSLINAGFILAFILSCSLVYYERCQRRAEERRYNMLLDESSNLSNAIQVNIDNIKIIQDKMEADLTRLERRLLVTRLKNKSLRHQLSFYVVKSPTKAIKPTKMIIEEFD